MNGNAVLRIAIVMLVAALGYAGPQTKWVNVHVFDPSEQTTVDVRLPLDFIGAAIDAVNTPEFRNGKITLDFAKRHEDEGEIEAEVEAEVDAAQKKEGVTITHHGAPDVDWVPLLQKMKTLPDSEFVKVDSPEAFVTVNKKNGYFLVNVQERGEAKNTVDVKLPVALLDAISIDASNQLDVKAFITKLGELPAGDLVRVTGEADVRIWVE
jgi:hypothetical protein